jgi:hypothetical protein
VITFRDKLRELVLAADVDPIQAEALHETATAYLEQFNDWPLTTQVPLSRVVEVVSALLLEPNVNVRRVRATDSLPLRDYLG